MELLLQVLLYLLYFILFIPVFIILFLLGFIKVAIFCPFVFLIVAFGDTAVVIGLWPVHLIWTSYCIAKSRKFGPYMKCLLVLGVPIPVVLWTIVGIVGSVIMGIFYAFIWPVMETFRGISQEGHLNKLVRCVTDGTWSNILGACTIVRDFAEFSFYSYFSVMDELLEAKGDEKPIEIKVLQVPGCILVMILGLLVDVPSIILIVLYKAPIMLIKGWIRLFEDLIGRSGPFLEDVCVPFAGLLIVLWPFVVLIAVITGIISSFGFGGYASVIAYQENSTKKGLLYIVSGVSLFDEYTNDFLSLREGSCFPRPSYRGMDEVRSPLLPINGLHGQIEPSYSIEPPMRSPSERIRALKAVVIWDNFFMGCERSGEELLLSGAIGLLDLEAWQNSKNKIVEIGIPAYTFMKCFLRSIKSCSSGFLVGDDVEITNINRPEGRIFDWLFEPMSIMKEQIKRLHLHENEELYLLKLSLYCGDAWRVESWDNGGIPPHNEIRRAQLEGIARRLHGFSVTVSRLPTFRRRFLKVIKTLVRHETQQSSGYATESQSELFV